MNRFIFTTAASLLCLSPFAAVYAQEGQPDGSCNSRPLITAQANPWDKYESAQPDSKLESSPKPSSQDSAATSASPWEKYEAAPVGTSPTVQTNENPEKGAEHSSTPQPSNDQPKNSEVKKSISTPAITEGAPTPEDDLPKATGTNPWDKYAPASSPVKSKKKNVAKVKERPAKLELAQPLPVLEVPTGERVIKSDLPVDSDNYFAIEYAGQLVGFSRYKINRLISLGGRSTYVIDSMARLKMGQDNIQDLKFLANLQVDKQTLTPAMFVCAQSSQDSTEAISLRCIYSNDFIAQSNNYTGKEQASIQKFTAGSPPALVFNNLWGRLDTFPEHYWLMVRAASQGGVLEAYDPILQGIGHTIVYKPIKESWQDRSGKNHTTLLYRITDLNSAPLAYVRLYADNYELAEIREIGSGLTFRRSTPGVLATLDKASGQRVKANSEIANIYFQDPTNLSHLEAFVDLRLRGGELAQHEISNYKQQFYGEVKEGQMKGRAVVNCKFTLTEPQAKFPFTVEVPQELKKYLEACPGIELEARGMATKAAEITWKSETAFQAAQRLTGYVANQIGSGLSLPSARLTLEAQEGNPDGKALLLTALLRSVKIPARTVGGIVYNNGSFMAHRWVEAWFGPEDGWLPFDPTTNESGFINASHIALCESGDIQALDVFVEKFAPRPPRSVDYFKTPLKWPIGEKRTYGIYHKGDLVGLEDAYMYDMQVNEGSETYNFLSEKVYWQNTEDAPLISEAKLTLTNNGLPLAFQASEDNGHNVSHSSFEFKGNNIRQILNEKDTKSLPRPAKSKALLEREQKETEQDADTPAQENSQEQAPKPSSVNLSASPAAEASPTTTPPSPVVTPGSAQSAEAIANNGNAMNSVSSGNATDSSNQAADSKSQLTSDTAEQSQAKNSQTTSSSDSAPKDSSPVSQQVAPSQADQQTESAAESQGEAPEEAISEEDKLQAELEAQKEAKLAARKEMHARLEEIKACYDEGKENDRAAKAQAQAQAAPSASDEHPEETSTEETTHYREIPYSVGTYLIDRRFLPQWALMIEQSPIISKEDTSKSEQTTQGQDFSNVDPNTGKVNNSEVIAPADSSQKTDEAPKEDNKKTEEKPAGETGAGTFTTKADSADDEDADIYTFHTFIPSDLSMHELRVQRAGSDETLTLPDGREVEAARLDTEDGVTFYMDLETGKVIKISIPSQEWEIVLENIRFEL